MPTLKKKSRYELYFAESSAVRGTGAVTLLLAPVSFFLTRSISGGEAASWICGSLFFLFSVPLLAWEHTLRLDLLKRRYLWRKGFWPLIREIEGSIPEFSHLSLVEEVRSTGGEVDIPYDVNVLYIHWPNDYLGPIQLNFFPYMWPMKTDSVIEESVRHLREVGQILDLPVKSVVRGRRTWH